MGPLISARKRLLIGLVCLVGIGLAAAATHLGPSAPAATRVRIDPTPVKASITPPVTAGPSHWITSWGAATQGPSLAAPLSEHGFKNQTLREPVFLTAGGTEVRVRFSDVFGSKPLRIAQATVALQRKGATARTGTVRQLRFDGRKSVVIGPGHERLSDPVKLGVAPLSSLLISLYLREPTGPATQQVDSRETSFAAKGSRALQTGPTGFRQKLQNWYFLAAVETRSPTRYLGSLIALGDSITAGVGSTLGTNSSWPDDLARRLNRLSGPTLSVVNEGIGGNRVLNDSPCCGISAVSRFNPDVVRQTGRRTVILLEGVNDLGFSQKTDSLSAPHTDVTAGQIISGYEQIIAQAHRHGLRIIGATLTPFKGARYWNPASEKKRETINNWILNSGKFDGTIDFAQVLASPSDPERLNHVYDSGDHLHPSDAGYWAMANAIELSELFPS
jgi:lysophospholipase L1-like esterase